MGQVRQEPIPLPSAVVVAVVVVVALTLVGVTRDAEVGAGGLFIPSTLITICLVGVVGVVGASSSLDGAAEAPATASSLDNGVMAHASSLVMMLVVSAIGIGPPTSLDGAAVAPAAASSSVTTDDTTGTHSTAEPSPAIPSGATCSATSSPPPIVSTPRPTSDSRVRSNI
jgi:hypothetical protein